ncbi:methyltransferase, partial [Escherichia coli]
GLDQLAPPVQEAWLRFDHFYSDAACRDAMPHMLPAGVDRLLDIGGNTGRFALACLRYRPEARVAIVDLPQQIAMARAFLAQHGVLSQVDLHACD